MSASVLQLFSRYKVSEISRSAARRETLTRDRRYVQIQAPVSERGAFLTKLWEPKYAKLVAKVKNNTYPEVSINVPESLSVRFPIAIELHLIVFTSHNYLNYCKT